MVILNGPINDVMYQNNEVLPENYGLCKYASKFYFVGEDSMIVKDSDIFFSDANKNGLTFVNSDPIVEGTYHFDENGVMGSKLD